MRSILLPLLLMTSTACTPVKHIDEKVAITSEDVYMSINKTLVFLVKTHRLDKDAALVIENKAYETLLLVRAGKATTEDLYAIYKNLNESFTNVRA